ncbi:MAG: LysR family transcriptional regulator [Pseudomonadota bacterium]|nr:LysR family transcriptional regulator [Pseudomonadota bacterium]
MNIALNHPVPLLELDLLRTFAAIVDTGSFAGAAEAVFRTPSAVSMQIKKLEETLGKPVLVRDSRAVSLTHEGEMLLEHARRVLALNREMMSRFISPDVAGVVRLGTPDDVAERFLPEMLRRFADSHCCVTVNVMVEGTAKLCEMVRQRALDIALITCEAGFRGDQAAEILYRERLVWGSAKCGVAAEQNPLPVSVWEEGCVWRKAGLSRLEAQGRDYRIAFQSAHISGQRAAILADLAVAPIPASSIGGSVVEAESKHGLPELPDYALGMLVADDPSAPVKAAADHLRACFAAKQASERPGVGAV